MAARSSRRSLFSRLADAATSAALSDLNSSRCNVCVLHDARHVLFKGDAAQRQTSAKRPMKEQQNK